MTNIGDFAANALRELQCVFSHDMLEGVGIKIHFHLHVAAALREVLQSNKFPSVYFFAANRFDLRVGEFQVLQRPRSRELSPKQALFDDVVMTADKLREN